MAYRMYLFCFERHSLGEKKVTTLPMVVIRWATVSPVCPSAFSLKTHKALPARKDCVY